LLKRHEGCSIKTYMASREGTFKLLCGLIFFTPFKYKIAYMGGYPNFKVPSLGTIYMYMEQPLLEVRFPDNTFSPVYRRNYNE
jgi:hypothetical protein